MELNQPPVSPDINITPITTAIVKIPAIMVSVISTPLEPDITVSTVSTTIAIIIHML